MKHKDKIAVYEACAVRYSEQKVLDTFKAAPKTLHGLDNYIYKGGLYAGYCNVSTGEIYIFLDHKVRSET